MASAKLICETLQRPMENTPSHTNPRAITKTMCEMSDVKNSHDLHIWNVTSGVIADSVPVNIRKFSDYQQGLVDSKGLLRKDYGIRLLLDNLSQALLTT